MSAEIRQGDCLELLREMPDGIVQTVVTSPPYWGLRDYGTAEWEGGDAGCDHVARTLKPSEKSTLEDHGENGRSPQLDALPGIPYRETCGKCGARRIDSQLGLEPTPDLYVQNLVEVFREVRRVLRDDGTAWINLGDSYAGSGKGQNGDGTHAAKHGEKQATSAGTLTGGLPTDYGDLKAKDLCGIPWRVAFALQADGWYLRSDIIWAKPNPMPESVRDRPTRSHEYIFLLSKSSRYYWDQEAVREPHLFSSWTAKGDLEGTTKKGRHEAPPKGGQHQDRQDNGTMQGGELSPRRPQHPLSLEHRNPALQRSPLRHLP